MGNFIYSANQALMSAATVGDLEGVKKALESGAQINYLEARTVRTLFQDVIHYETALTRSASKGHLKVVQYLCEAGANPYLPYNQKSPLDLAESGWPRADAIANHLEMVMTWPKNLNKIDDATGYTPLTHCIANQCIKRTKTLIDNGADVCKVDRHGKTPLIYAIEEYSIETIYALLQRGAIVSGVSAMKRAFELEYNDILNILIHSTFGPMIDGYFDDGFTPLTKSIITQNTEIAKCLIQKGANVRKVDLHNNTPLQRALERHCLDIANLLVSKGAQVPKTLPDFLFQRLAEDGHQETYNFIVKHGWDVNQVDGSGKTALSHSASKQNLLLSLVLIAGGARIDLAQHEIDEFRANSMDFDIYLQEDNNATHKKNNSNKKMLNKNINADVKSNKKNWGWKQIGQEEEPSHTST